MVLRQASTEKMQKRKRAAAQKCTVFLALLCVFVMLSQSMCVRAAEPKVTVTKKTLYVGYESYQIRFKNLAKNAKVTYKSSDKKVATVSTKGVIKPVKKGTATVTVTIKQSGKTYTRKIAVTVKNPYISVTNKKTTLVQSSAYQLIGKAYGFKKSKLTFTSSNVLVAKVEKESGLLQARSAGTATITMKDTVNGKSVSFTVKVVKKTEKNEGNVYISTADMDKSYVYTAPKDTSGMSDEEIASTKQLAEIQKKITQGASITIHEMELYYTQKMVELRQ